MCDYVWDTYRVAFEINRKLVSTTNLYLIISNKYYY